MPNWTLHQGECLDVLKTLPDNSVDSVVTDPPYGLSNHDAGDVREALRCWLDGKPYTPKGSGFMGKGWDAFVPGPEVWSECLRVLKPGGHLLVFAGTRTQDLMGMAVRLAGFDARDSVIVQGMLHWNYASGAMTKSLDVSKAIDKAAGAERTEVIGIAKGVGKQNPEWNGTAKGRAENSFKPEYEVMAPATDVAKQWNGWGTALRPTQEPVLVFRKPLEGTVADNVLKYGTGGINIDGCRLASQSRTGRWPTNTVFCHAPKCVRVGTDTVDKTCVDGCPVKALDEQSGDLHARGNKTPTKSSSGMFGHPSILTDDHLREELKAEGGASRFYPQFTYEEGDNPFLYCAKASRSERDEGLPDRENKHPTVKPIALMRWLARLVTPANGVVLDPFNGSGTTGCAAMLEGFQYVGIEREAEYVGIARARIAHHERVVQGGVKNPWTENPTVETTETAPLSLDDLFGL